MRIILTGGGTGGSVAPLLAIAEEIRKQKSETEFLFIGTKKGQPEKEMIKNYNFTFIGIICGKLRRYFSWQNFLDIFRIKIGILQSIFILKKFRPDLIIGAGGFVSVPVIFSCFFLKIPSLIHQQDIIPSLTNKILSPFVKKITVSFEKSLNDFCKNKTVLTGNPVREMIMNGDKERAIKKFNLERNLPTLLFIGGGTGAQKINELILKTLPELTKFCQIIHLTGKGKLKIENSKLEINRYYPHDFLTEEIVDVYAVADLVISRAGMNALTELAILGKPTIIIPIPNSHQEVNAKYFAEKKAAIFLDQKELTSRKLVNEIKGLLNNQEKRKNLEENIKKIMPTEAAQKIIQEIIKFIEIEKKTR